MLLGVGRDVLRSGSRLLLHMRLGWLGSGRLLELLDLRFQAGDLVVTLLDLLFRLLGQLAGPIQTLHQALHGDLLRLLITPLGDLLREFLPVVGGLLHCAVCAVAH